MTWWKAALLDVITLVVASGLTVLILRHWLERRAQMQWPKAAATVTAYKQGPGFKGRSATYLVGQYASDDRTYAFSVVWGPSDFERSSWVPPADVPPVGSTIPVHVNPHRPGVVALESGPAVVTSLGAFLAVGVIVFLAVTIGIAVWFM